MKDIEQQSEQNDPLFAELRRLSPRVTGGIMRARQAAYENGTVAGKYKLLTALAISIAIRCEPCIRAYVKMAVEQGATQEEFMEFLNVAMTMQGCPGEEWSLKAYGFYKKLVAGETQESIEACCQTHPT